MKDSEVQQGGDIIAVKEKRSTAVKLVMSSSGDSCSDGSDIDRTEIKKENKFQTEQPTSVINSVGVSEANEESIHCSSSSSSSSNDSPRSTANKINKINTKTFPRETPNKREVNLLIDVD